MTEEQLAGMTRDELSRQHALLLRERAVATTRTTFLESVVGKAFLEGKRADLNWVTGQYGKIPTTGAPEEIVRALLVLQTREDMLRKELAKYEEIDKNKKMLDKSIKICHTIINTRDSAEKTHR